MILAQQLSKSFGQNLAVDNVSLQVAPGEIYGLVGPDGAGKTTLIRLLCGALRLESGAAEVMGCSILEAPEQARAQIGYLPQRFSMYEDLTVEENVRFFSEVRGLDRQDWKPRSREILSFVGLNEFSDRRAGRLSGGMKQKLGLAVALVHRPKVLLLDEPTTGVDPITRQDFWQLIIRLVADEAVAVLVSTPYMDEAARCHRLGFMRSGHLMVEGTPAEVRALLDGRILELTGAPLRQLRQFAVADPDVENAQMFGDRLHLRIRAAKGDEVVARLRAQTPPETRIETLKAVPPQLEDVFIALLEAEEEAS